MTSDCLNALKVLRGRYGTYEFDRALKALYRERLEVENRPKRIRLSPRRRERLYFRHGGICHECGTLIDPKSNWEVDHVNVNLASDEYNDERNLAPTCAACNRKKSAKSIPELAKSSGRTMKEIVEVKGADRN